MKNNLDPFAHRDVWPPPIQYQPDLLNIVQKRITEKRGKQALLIVCVCWIVAPLTILIYWDAGLQIILAFSIGLSPPISAFLPLVLGLRAWSSLVGKWAVGLSMLLILVYVGAALIFPCFAK